RPDDLSHVVADEGEDGEPEERPGQEPLDEAVFLAQQARGRSVGPAGRLARIRSLPTERRPQRPSLPRTRFTIRRSSCIRKAKAIARNADAPARTPAPTCSNWAP